MDAKHYLHLFLFILGTSFGLGKIVWLLLDIVSVLTIFIFFVAVAICILMTKRYFKEKKDLILYLDLLLGLISIISAYSGGLLLSEMISPGGKYLDMDGMILVGVLIFIVCIAIAYIGNFDKLAILVLPILTVAFVVAFSRGFQAVLEVWTHVLIPVALSSIIILLSKAICSYLRKRMPK